MLARSSTEAGARLRRSKSTLSARQSYYVSPVQSCEWGDSDERRRYAVAAAAYAYGRAQAGYDRNPYRARADLHKKRSLPTMSLTDRERCLQQRKKHVRRREPTLTPVDPTSWSLFDQSSPAAERHERATAARQGAAGTFSTPMMTRSLARTRSFLSRRGRSELEQEPRTTLKGPLRRSKSLATTAELNSHDEHCRAPELPGDNHTHSPHDGGEQVSQEVVPITEAHEPSFEAESDQFSNFVGADGSSPIAQSRTGTWRTEEARRRQQTERTLESSAPHQPEQVDKADSAKEPRSDGNVMYSSGSHMATLSSFLHPRGKRLAVTSTLKSRMKRFFRRRSLSMPSSPPTNFPVQQATASRTYYGDFTNIRTFGGSAVSGQGTGSLSDGGSPTIGAASLPNSRQPSNATLTSKSAGRTVTSDCRNTSFTFSEPQDAEEKSRVTSWADSTFTAMPADSVSCRDMKLHSSMHGPLSSIPEAPPASQSAQLGRSLYNTLMSLTKLKEAKNNVRRLSPPPEERAECSQRGCVYGSLRISHEHVRRISYDGNNEDTVVPSPGSKGHGAASLGCRLSQATLRLVPSGTATNVSTASLGNDEKRAEFGSTQDEVAPNLDGRRDEVRQRQAVPPSSSLIASRMERSENRWQTPLEESRSVVFPRTPAGHFRAGVEAYLDQITTSSSVPTELTPTNLRDLRDAVTSPSIYSQDGDGSLPDGHGPGTAVILESSPVKSFTLWRGTRSQDRTATGGSRDWRAWLSKEVEDLGSSPPETISVREWDQYSLSPRGAGHRREHAGIVEDEPTTLDDLMSHAELPTEKIESEGQNDDVSIIHIERLRPRLQEQSLSRANEYVPPSTVDTERRDVDVSDAVQTVSQTLALPTDVGAVNFRASSARNKENAPPPYRHTALPNRDTVPLQTVQRPMPLQTLRSRVMSNPYEEDSTITRIRAGPYATTAATKGNSGSSQDMPRGERSLIPVWTGTRKTPGHVEVDGPMRLPVSIPTRTGSPTPSTGGQRLAERFLNERRDEAGELRWRNESPMFL